MTDDERIEMYFKFGLADWENEQAQYKNGRRKTTCRLTATVGKMLNLIDKYAKNTI